MRKTVFPLLFVTLFLAIAVSTQVLAKNDLPEITDDGLERVLNTEVTVAYVAPGTDFSQYTKVMLLGCEVAFKKNWLRDHKRGSARGVGGVTSKDMEKVRTGLAAAFDEIFAEELQGNGGYTMVDEVGEDVLLIRPNIINLDMAEIGQTTPGSYSLSKRGGEMTLVLEFFDSATFAVLGRAYDVQATGDSAYMKWQTTGKNRNEANRVLGRWAGLLRAKLDEVHGRPAE
jgi:hypothetical protein